MPYMYVSTPGNLKVYVMFLQFGIVTVIAYRIVQTCGSLANRSFQSFGEENVGKSIANISYFSESGIWLGKILANDICFAKVLPWPPEFCAVRYIFWYLY